MTEEPNYQDSNDFIDPAKLKNDLKKIYDKDDYGDDRVVDEYSIDTIKNYYNMDESPEDFELEDIIKRSFKNRLKVAYASDGKRGLERVLEPFEFLH